ncbi:hypothetical protein A1D22_02900 [Pasteurellaceae bacterium LFhippo2]|nr:hypothetical protein [Pasteurellaceae bacterium LFhippo2]
MLNPEGVFFLDGGSINEKVKFDLNTLKNPDGSILGVHSGKIVNEGFVGEVISYYPKETKDLTEINYLVVNQPYSSYGVLFSNENDQRFFAVGQRAGSLNNSTAIANFSDTNEYSATSTVVDSNSLITEHRWNDAVLGDAIYKGQVIANTERAAYLVNQTLPKIDGTVTLNAHFDSKKDASYVSGAINSDTLGKIELPKANIVGADQILAMTGYAVSGNNVHATKGSDSFVGKYETRFVGENFNDVIGRVNLTNDKAVGKEMKHYNAVFGATKQ